jgi:hypothetical protein
MVASDHSAPRDVFQRRLLAGRAPSLSLNRIARDGEGEGDLNGCFPLP